MQLEIKNYFLVKYQIENYDERSISWKKNQLRLALKNIQKEKRELKEPKENYL